ncbi:MAG: hypothetical protein IPM08_09555 [Actinomycetales bacterium]|nr:hypothetical protein [Actinomycetales bacterium]
MAEEVEADLARVRLLRVRTAYRVVSTASPSGSKCKSSRCGKRRRSRSHAPMGRSASVRCTWHQAASAQVCAGSTMSASSSPRSTAMGRTTGVACRATLGMPSRNSTRDTDLLSPASLKSMAHGDPL